MIRLLLGSAVALAATLAHADHSAQPVKLVVPFPAGNTGDIVARILSDGLAAKLGQPVIVENKAGAGGSIGVQSVATAAPDGRTLLITTSSPLVLNPSIYKSLPYNVERDLTPVALLGWIPTVLVMHPSVPAKTVPELVRYMQANPGKLSYASVGNGSYAHVTMELFKQGTKTDPIHVPYKGTGPAVTDLIGGQVNMMFDTIASANPQAQAGRVRALAVTSKKRSTFAPDLPAIAELNLPGMADFDVVAWIAVYAPANTPRPIVDRLNKELNTLIKTPEIIEKLGARSVAVYPASSPEVLGALARAETMRWAQIIKAAHIEAE